jgi:hypothetical protein
MGFWGLLPQVIAAVTHVLHGADQSGGAHASVQLNRPGPFGRAQWQSVGLTHQYLPE